LMIKCIQLWSWKLGGLLVFYLPLVDSEIFQRTVWNISHNCEKFLQSFVFFVQEKRVLSGHTEVVVVMVKCFFFFCCRKETDTQRQRDKARERIRVCFYCSRTWKSCVVRDVNALDLCIVRDAEQIFGVEIMTKHKVLQFFTFCILNFVQFGEGWTLLGIYVKSSWNPNKKLLKEALESPTFYIGFPNLSSPI
jgi:hypothetical protein